MVDAKNDDHLKDPLQEHLTHTVCEESDSKNKVSDCYALHDAAQTEPVKPDLESQTIENKAIPKTVRYLGIMMFLMNCSFVMVFSFSGLYLRSLGMPNVGIGFVEGIAEAISFLMKFFSGVLSDVLGRRKPVMFVGYTLSILSRPIMAAATSFIPFFCAKMIERVGNGIQATPRDAIVADITPSKRIGAAYGLKRSLATIGSMMGAILGFLTMKFTNDNMRTVFWLSCIPASIAFLFLIFGVKEPKRIEHSAVSAEVPLPALKRKHRIALAKLPLLGNTFWLLMIINAIFMLARMSEQFIILHANVNYGLAARAAPLIMIVFNIGWCLTSYPVGLIADKMNRYWLLSLGMILMSISGIVLATAANLYILFVGVLLWGFQYGIVMNIFSSLIAETVPESLRGTGFGFYYIISAIAAVLAETMAGKLADLFGYHSAFVVSSIIGLIALSVLIVIMAIRSAPRKIL